MLTVILFHCFDNTFLKISLLLRSMFGIRRIQQNSFWSISFFIIFRRSVLSLSDVFSSILEKSLGHLVEKFVLFLCGKTPTRPQSLCATYHLGELLTHMYLLHQLFLQLYLTSSIISPLTYSICFFFK